MHIYIYSVYIYTYIHTYKIIYIYIYIHIDYSPLNVCSRATWCKTWRRINTLIIVSSLWHQRTVPSSNIPIVCYTHVPDTPYAVPCHDPCHTLYIIRTIFGQGCIYKYVQTCVYMYIHVYMCIYIYIYILRNAILRRRSDARHSSPSAEADPLYGQIYKLMIDPSICLSISLSLSIYIYIYTYLYKYIYIYTYIHTTSLSLYIYIYIHISPCRGDNIIIITII